MLSLCPIVFIIEKALQCCQAIWRRLNKEQIKKQLFGSFVCDDINKEDVSATADPIKDYQETMETIKECENIIKTNKKKIIDFAYEQGKIFRKIKEDTNFKNLVEQFRINKITIIFEINIVKLVEKYNKCWHQQLR